MATYKTNDPYHNGEELVDLDDKLRPTQTRVERSGSGSEEDTNHVARPQHTMTKAIWLACIALCFTFTTAFQQNICTAAIVKHIDTELGPTTYYNWMLSSYTIAVSIALPLSGGLSDIFGRKGFFLVGCTISLTGTVIALAAKNVPMVIAGMILKGIGSGSQQLALAAIGELVPNKHRGNAQAVLDLVTLPWSIFGALTGNAMIKYTRLSFRINFIVGVALNVISIVTIWLWYHPPGGRVGPGETKMGKIRELDWTGVTLMAIGIVLTLSGLAFGGNQYPWNSGSTIAPIVVGIITLMAFFIWEWRIARRPFFAHELFRGKFRTFTIQLFLTFIGGMSLYTALAFWTQQAQGMFVNDPIAIGVSAIPGGVGGAIGGFLGGVMIGKGRLFGTNHILIYATAMKLGSDIAFTQITPNDFKLALGMGFLAMFGMGFMLVALIVAVQLASEDRHIGLATLVLGSIRAIGGSVAVTIYTSIMMNTVKEDAPTRIGKAIIPMGFPKQGMPNMVRALLAHKESAAAKIPGATPEIIHKAADVVKWSWALAFKRIYYAACAFSALGLLMAFFVKDISHNMTDSVAVQLTNDTEKATEKKQRPGS